MKKIVISYGLISGAISALLMLLSVFVLWKNGDGSMLLGYTCMILSFSLIYFAMLNYKKTAGKGSISFGKAMAIGLLISVIASLCYAITWMIISEYKFPHFMEDYAARAIEKMRAHGDSAAAIEKQSKEMAKWVEMYKNPLVKFGMTFMEQFPVGIIVTLISAPIARMGNKKNNTPAEA